MRSFHFCPWVEGDWSAVAKGFINAALNPRHNACVCLVLVSCKSTWNNLEGCRRKAFSPPLRKATALRQGHRSDHLDGNVTGWLPILQAAQRVRLWIKVQQTQAIWQAPTNFFSLSFIVKSVFSVTALRRMGGIGYYPSSQSRARLKAACLSKQWNKLFLLDSAGISRQSLSEITAGWIFYFYFFLMVSLHRCLSFGVLQQLFSLCQFCSLTILISWINAS